MPPSYGAEGTHGRGEAESYSSYSYTPSSEESEEERCLKQSQGIGEKRQRRVHLQRGASKGVPPIVSDWSSEGLESSKEEGEVSESSKEEEASPKESASKSGKRQRLHHSAVAESSRSEGMEEERKAPAARGLVDKAMEALARAQEALALAEQAEQAEKQEEEEARREKERQKEKEARAQASEKEEKEALREREEEGCP